MERLASRTPDYPCLLSVVLVNSVYFLRVHCYIAFILSGVLQFEAEVRGILEAVTWLEELQLSGVDIETDSLLAVKALKMGTEYNLEVGDVLAQCRSILDARPDFAIYFVKRQANMAAHLLARAPCMVNCFNVFMSPPDFLLETLMFDLVLS